MTASETAGVTELCDDISSCIATVPVFKEFTAVVHSYTLAELPADGNMTLSSDGVVTLSCPLPVFSTTSSLSALDETTRFVSSAFAPVLLLLLALSTSFSRFSLLLSVCARFSVCAPDDERLECLLDERELSLPLLRCRSLLLRSLSL